MSDDRRPTNRRRFLAALAASAAAPAVAGCSGGGSDGSDGGDGSADDTDDPTDPAPTDTAAPSAETTEPSSGETTESPSTDPPADEAVTVDLSLAVASSRSGVENFSTLRTQFDAVELAGAGGETVRLDDASQEIDLTELGPGGSVDLFRTTVPPGTYEEGSLYLPVQSATLSDGSDPEFDRTVPSSRDLRSRELTAGDAVSLTVTVRLLRIAGDGPWTYTVAFGFS